MGFAPTSFLTGLLFLSVVVLPVLVAFSALTFYLIEEPFLTMRRKYLQASPVVPMGTASEQRRAA
jgi:peptidoglycan/LPS O-acetylase OafA/YrhL